MSAQPVRWYTPEEYLDLERASDIKHEYYGGEIFAMSGASREHNLVAGNIHTEFNVALRGGPCEVYPSDMRVLIEATGLFTYPDVVVAYDGPRFGDQHVDTLLNPTLVVEVLSPSTERYDRVTKAGMYRSIPSLRAYLFAAQDRPRLELYTRAADGASWLLTVAEGIDAALHVPTVGVDLALANVYTKVVL